MIFVQLIDTLTIVLNKACRNEVGEMENESCHGRMDINGMTLKMHLISELQAADSAPKGISHLGSFEMLPSDVLG